MFRGGCAEKENKPGMNDMRIPIPNRQNCPAYNGDSDTFLVSF